MKMSNATTTDPTDGSTVATLNATSTSTDANQRDHDNQDVGQSDADKDTLDFECKDDGGGKS